MRFRTLTVLAMCLSTFCWLSAAQAQPNFRFTGGSVPTAISGITPATGLTPLELVLDNTHLIGVTVWERSDRPCSIIANFNGPSSSSAANSSPSLGCTRPGRLSDRGRSGKSARVPTNIAVTELRVCLRGDRVKGVAVSGRPLNCALGRPAGPGENCGAAAALIENHFERSGCPGRNRGPDNDWSSIVARCPANRIASGLRVNQVTDTSENARTRTVIQGIGLLCRRVVSF